MRCDYCNKHILNPETGDKLFVSKHNKIICETCKAIRDSFKYYIGGKEVTKEEYDKFLEDGTV